ncbi:MAG: enolase C-terminal domain-like protein, partial [Acidimicrobiia bacterium]
MPLVEHLTASAFTVPTDVPESDGTFAWDATTIVVVEAHTGAESGLGYSYTAAPAAALINEVLGPRVVGADAMAVPEAWKAMVASVRNLGRPGLASTAIAAADA